jgi:hypothetical protein
MMTRAEFMDMLNAEGVKSDVNRNLSKKFERGTSSFLLSKIPSLSDTLLNLRDVLLKYSFVQFQN